MQGFNMGRYYPPDASNPPSFNTSSHPLGARAKKIDQGILTVRFEMPFPIWCSHCSPAAIIGQGVRFNAEKKKVGNYYSTPIWQFRMKHTACGGWIEIRTDPKMAEYVVVEGAKRRDYGEDKREEGELGMLSEAERERRREDAFAGLEGRKEEKGKEREHRERVEELLEAQEREDDPYELNRKLRRGFRAKRKVWQKDDRQKEDMQERFGVGFDIVDEVEGDRIRAGLVEFGTVGQDDFLSELDLLSARKPLFASAETNGMAKKADEKPKTKRLKAEALKEKKRDDLQQSILGNTRAAMNPFLGENGSKNSMGGSEALRALKRKRVDLEGAEASKDIKEHVAVAKSAESIKAADPKALPLLVDYDSD